MLNGLKVEQMKYNSTKVDEIASTEFETRKIPQIAQNKNNPFSGSKVFIGISCAIIVIAAYFINSNNKPQHQTVQQESELLDELTDKVLRGLPLNDADFIDLCRIMQLKVCDSCTNYIIARLGGNNDGHYNRFKNSSDSELKRGIRSFEKQIQQHHDKIANPQAHYPNWQNLDPRERDALLNRKWYKDIKRLTEQKEILECILKNR